MNPKELSIYIIDDEAIFAKVLKFDLEDELPDAEISYYSDPSVALTKCIQNRPSIIVLDISMPEMNGITFVKKLHEAKINIPTILMTQYWELLDEDIKIDYSINKPFHTKDLVAIIQEIIAIKS